MPLVGLGFFHPWRNTGRKDQSRGEELGAGSGNTISSGLFPLWCFLTGFPHDLHPLCPVCVVFKPGGSDSGCVPLHRAEVQLLLGRLSLAEIAAVQEGPDTDLREQKLPGDAFTAQPHVHCQK